MDFSFSKYKEASELIKLICEIEKKSNLVKLKSMYDLTAKFIETLTYLNFSSKNLDLKLIFYNCLIINFFKAVSIMSYILILS